MQASHVLADADVIAAIPALTKWGRLLTDSYALPPTTFSFMSFADFQAGQAGSTPRLFLNKHSSDPTALGFHEVQDGVPYGRSFSGDDQLDNIDPWVTMSHEAGEMILNAYIQEFVTLRDGSQVPKEACDAVEDDAQAIIIDNIPFSNFVLPTYWQDGVQHPLGTRFDYQGRLHGPCPALTPGGYQAILPPGAADWTQLTAMLLGSKPRPSVRQQRFHGSLRHRQLIAVHAP